MNDDEFRQKLKDFKSLSSAFFGPAIVLTAIELGVFTALRDGPLLPAAVATALKVDAPSISTLMGALVSLGYLQKDGDRFANTPFSAKALVQGQPSYEGDSALMSLWFLRSTRALSQIVRTGKPQETFEDAVNASPETARFLVRAMDQVSRDFVEALRKNVDMMGVRRVLDVGGAAGSYAMALLRDHPAARATVMELPNAALEARRVIAEQGFADRVDVVAQDFHTADFGSGWDVIFFSNIFHLLDAATCADLIARVSRALAPGGRFVVKDMLGHPSGVLPAGQAVYAILMLMVSQGGALHSQDAFATWCSAAGLEPPVRVDCWERSSLLMATKPKV